MKKIQEALPKVRYVVLCRDQLGEFWELRPCTNTKFRAVYVQPPGVLPRCTLEGLAFTPKGLLTCLKALDTASIWKEPLEDCDDEHEPLLLNRSTLMVRKMEIALSQLDTATQDIIEHMKGI